MRFFVFNSYAGIRSFTDESHFLFLPLNASRGLPARRTSYHGRGSEYVALTYARAVTRGPRTASVRRQFFSFVAFFVTFFLIFFSIPPQTNYYRDHSEFLCVSNGNRYQLIIAHAKLTHTGTYTLLAANPHGQIKALISLQVYSTGKVSARKYNACVIIIATTRVM